MRRRPLHIAVALCACAAGFLAAGRPGPLAYLLPSSLAAFLLHGLWRWLLKADEDLHHAKVVVVTVLLWIPLLAVVLRMFAPAHTSCVVEAAEEYSREEAQAPPPARLAETPHVEGLGGPCYVGESFSVGEQMNLVWAGMLDRKALSKPGAVYPPDAWAAHISGKVAVTVLVDGSGHVSAARAISGHPRLRREAERAACLAKFPHAFVDGPAAPKVRGVLTYRFGL